MWTLELNLADNEIGGDSITAMTVISRCRKEGINLSLNEVLRSKSINQLAQTAGSGTTISHQEEKIDEPFELSPVQKMYFETATDYQGQSRFNQSFSLQITKFVHSDSVKNALEAILNKHSMLRVRFSRSSKGTWQQQITKVCFSRICSLVEPITLTMY